MTRIDQSEVSSKFGNNLHFKFWFRGAEWRNGGFEFEFETNASPASACGIKSGARGITTTTTA